jgi:hypothetical protein
VQPSSCVSLTDTVTAAAAAAVASQSLFDAAAKAAKQLMPGFAPQGIVNVLWAYTTALKHIPEDLLTAASEECLARGSKLAGFGPLNLAMLAWVHAKCRTINPPLAAALSRAALQNLHAFSAADLCKFLASMAQLRCADVQLLDAAESRLLSFFERRSNNEEDVQVLCQGVWAFAASNHPGAATLIEPLLAVASRQLGKVVRSGDATARLLGTLVLLRYRADGFMQLLADKLLFGAAAGAAATSAQPHRADGAAVLSESAAATAAAAGTGQVVNHLARWDTKYLVQASACLARLGYTQHTALLQLLLTQFTARLPKVHSSTARSDSSSSNQASIQQQALLRPFANHAALLLWCCAVLDVQPQCCRDELQRLLQVLRRAEAAGCTLPQQGLAQLVQVQMWLQVRAVVSAVVFDCAVSAACLHYIPKQAAGTGADVATSESCLFEHYTSSIVVRCCVCSVSRLACTCCLFAPLTVGWCYLLQSLSKLTAVASTASAYDCLVGTWSGRSAISEAASQELPQPRHHPVAAAASSRCTSQPSSQ